MKLLLSLFIIIITTNLQDDFIFVNGTEKVRLKIDEGKKYLEWDKTSTLNIEVENIDPKKLSFSAPGISFKKGEKKDNELNLLITPTKEIFDKDSIYLYLSYKNEKQDFIHHKFSILIK